MIKYFFNEEFREIQFDEGALQRQYAVSNYGRVVSFEKEIKTGRILRCGKVQGYPTLKVNTKSQGTAEKQGKTFFVHKLVAEFFLPRTSENQKYVLHKDFNKVNNVAANLFWATEDQKNSHYNKNPKVLENREKLQNSPRQEGHKLSTTEVMRIKKKIFDPERKTRMKLIAKQFNISEMQLYRIRSGENWAHVKVNVLGASIGVAKEFEDMMAQSKKEQAQMS